MKQLICMLLIMLSASLTACSNTLDGLGKDMQELGKSIQKSIKD